MKIVEAQHAALVERTGKQQGAGDHQDAGRGEPARRPMRRQQADGQQGERMKLVVLHRRLEPVHRRDEGLAGRVGGKRAEDDRRERKKRGDDEKYFCGEVHIGKSALARRHYAVLPRQRVSVRPTADPWPDTF